MSAERFVVIGSNSFSGAHFAAAALEEGAEVLGASRSPEPEDLFLPYKWIRHERFTFLRADLNRDLDELDAAIRQFQPDYVVNFAAQGMVAQSWSRPEHWYQTNTVAMARLHQRLSGCEFLKKFVQASTPEVYGSTSGLVREDAPLSPSTPYAVSKAACDLNLLAYFKVHGLPVAFTRSANVCGPGQQLYRILPKTILCILTGKKLRLEGGGHSIRSFIHVRDVAEATLRVARQGAAGEVYHLATPRNLTIRDLVGEVCRQMEASFEESVEVVEGRIGQDAAYLLDCAKARAELGWSPRRSLEDAIGETIAWMEQNLSRVRELPAEYIHKE